MNDKALAAQVLENEFKWLEHCIQQRLSSYFQPPKEAIDLFELCPPPEFPENAPGYGKLLRELNDWLFSSEIVPRDDLKRYAQAQRLVLALALAPHYCPEILDVFFTKNSLYERPYTEFGGSKDSKAQGFMPTGETALFLVCGVALPCKLALNDIFGRHHLFYKKNILQLGGVAAHEPMLSGSLLASSETLARLTSNQAYEPAFNSAFPAKRIYTKLTDKDLVLAPVQRQMIEDIFVWIDHETSIFEDWKLDKIFRPGFRALFYGPPGTGKTLCATILGQWAERPVYRVDLSQIVSKYIGETEKNLARLFDQAEHRNWILFFDEADALFGKRTATTDAKDRYANQEVAYLLQRIEDYNGLIILASNLKGNIDEAFARRFQSMIYFPLPNQDQRFQIWKNTLDQFPQLVEEKEEQTDYAEESPRPKRIFRSHLISAQTLARDYELAGGNIVNAIRSATMAALRRGKAAAAEKTKEGEEVKEKDYVILLEDVVFGIKAELKKMGQLT